MFLSAQNRADLRLSHRSHGAAGRDGDAWLGLEGLFATHLLSLLNQPSYSPPLQDTSVCLPIVSATGQDG